MPGGVCMAGYKASDDDAGPHEPDRTPLGLAAHP